MDIAAFIIELLAQQGILVIPGLGTFTRNRVDGYYDKEQQQFYPPTVQIQFKTDYTDDNVLAQMISEERLISVASAKYFIEKFVANIKDQAAVGSVAFGNIGTFSTRRIGLVFTSNELNENDELYYGLAPVKLKRNSAFKHQPVITPPVELPPVPEEVIPEPVQPYLPETVEEEIIAEEEYLEEEEEEKRGVNIWLVLAIIIVTIGAALIGAYKFKPELFDRFTNKQTVAVVQAKLSKADSLKQALQAQKDLGITPVDSSGKAKTDIAGVDTFRIVAGSFKTLRMATREADNYTKKGVTAGVNFNIKNKRYEVNAGTYLNSDSAQAALPVMKQKLNKPDIYIQTYPFKKQ